MLARSENHPESWWHTSGYEHDNMVARSILSFATCRSGYTPTFGTCVKRSLCLATACPGSLLMRAYRTKQYRTAMEIVRGELEKKEYRVAKALFMGVGWGFMSMVALWT